MQDAHRVGGGRGGRRLFPRGIPGGFRVCKAMEGVGGAGLSCSLVSGFLFPLPLSPAGYEETGPGFAI